MRIVASNPDGLGDLILRQPTYVALEAAGHALLLLVRPPLYPWARLLYPGAQIAEICVEPYLPVPEAEGPENAGLQPLVQRVRAFRPDLLLIAPFQWTYVEEHLIAAFPEVRAAGMTGARYPATVNHGQARPRMEVCVEAPAELPEWEKNRRLGEAVLGAPLSAAQSTLRASPAHIDLARRFLAARGWTGNSAWMVCVGDSASNSARNWPGECWAALLKYGVERYGLHFVLCGHQTEVPANRRILETLGPGAAALLEHSDDQIDLLVGLMACTAGYVGRDTGLVHLASALGKRVLVVGGSGTISRYVPLAPAGRVVTLDVPCQNCGWVCHLPIMYCVKEIPLADATAAFSELLDGCGDMRILRVSRPAVVAQQMERAAAATGRHHIWLLGLRQKQLETALAATVKEREATLTGVERASEPSPLRLHLGHHFFGAGNLGDDLMLAGFLSAARALMWKGALSCATPFDRTSQQHRFPEVAWLPYDREAREDSIRRCDAWLGLGGSPFQSDGGTWFLDHLRQELEMCRRHGKPMYFLGVGCNDRAALAHATSRDLLDYAAAIWTRDRASAEMLMSNGCHGVLTIGADLAHIYLRQEGSTLERSREVAFLLNFENLASFCAETFAQVIRRLDVRPAAWLVQEWRPLPGSESALLEMLSAETAAEVCQYRPDYAGAGLQHLFAAWPAPSVLISSRYHGLIVGAWRGSRLVCVRRNDKLAGLAADLDLVSVPNFRDAGSILSAMVSSRAVPRELLEARAERAVACCRDFFSAVQAAVVRRTEAPKQSCLVEVARADVDELPHRPAESRLSGWLVPFKKIRSWGRRVGRMVGR